MKMIKRGTVSLACNASPGVAPRIVFCPGFNSNRHGDKALALEKWCRAKGLAYTRFDYSGHGDSTGDFADGTISQWLADTLAVIDDADEKVVLVGSSMGGWLALLAALNNPEKITGLVLLACATDMTRYYSQRLNGLSPERDCAGRVYYSLDNQYDDQVPYRIYQNLIDDGEQHFLMEESIPLSMPISLLHGMQDDVVEWQRSARLAELLESEDVTVTLSKSGDHRLSRDADLTRIYTALKRYV